MNYLHIDHCITGYDGETVKAPELLEAWLKDALSMNPELESWKWHLVIDLGAKYLFNSGRMYGIHQERERRAGK